MSAPDSPGYFDEVVLVDSTPVECGGSLVTGTPLSARAGLRAALQPQSQPLVFAHAAAPAGRAGRHAARRDAGQRRPEGARRGAALARDRSARWRAVGCDKG